MRFVPTIPDTFPVRSSRTNVFQLPDYYRHQTPSACDEKFISINRLLAFLIKTRNLARAHSRPHTNAKGAGMRKTAFIAFVCAKRENVCLGDKSITMFFPARIAPLLCLSNLPLTHSNGVFLNMFTLSQGNEQGLCAFKEGNEKQPLAAV